MAHESLRQSRPRTYGSTMDAEIGFAGPASSAEMFDQPAFNRLCDKITSNVYQIAKHGALNLQIYHVNY